MILLLQSAQRPGIGSQRAITKHGLSLQARNAVLSVDRELAT